MDKRYSIKTEECQLQGLDILTDLFGHIFQINLLNIHDEIRQ